MSHPYRVVALEPGLDRESFASGSEPLDRYLKTQISQDIKRRIAAGFVALAEDNSIAGYYTLASASVLLDELPLATAKRLPRYPSIPAVRMGRLAVDQGHKGKGLGGALLADALVRVANSEIAAFALIVDAKDAAAQSFYLHHGFVQLESDPLSLFLPIPKSAPRSS